MAFGVNWRNFHYQIHWQWLEHNVVSISKSNDRIYKNTLGYKPIKVLYLSQFQPGIYRNANDWIIYNFFLNLLFANNRVVHSWPFSSIFHPFLTSFLSSFSLHAIQKWNSESKRNGYGNIYFWQNGTQNGTLTSILQKVNWKMIIFHRFGTVPGEKNAFSHHFSKFSFPGCSR